MHWWLSHKPCGGLPLLSTRLPGGYLPSHRASPSSGQYWQRHTGASSSPKDTMEWCPSRTRTSELQFQSPMPQQPLHFSISGRLSWNNLPNKLQNIIDFSCFKHRVKSFLFSHAFNWQSYYALAHCMFLQLAYNYVLYICMYVLCVYDGKQLVK